MKVIIFISLVGALAQAAELQDLSRRNIFAPLIAPAPKPPKIQIVKPVLPPPSPRIPLSQRLSNLKLVGFMDTDPRQAIIEDQRSQKTIYVSAGQPINDVKVENITNDSVIFTADDEHFNLSM